MSLNWCNNSAGLPDDQPTYYSGSQTTIEKVLLLHCSVHTPPRASRCHPVQGKHTREQRAQAWLKVLATSSELRKALAPSGHERDEQLPEAWRHDEPTHSNTTFRVRISQHKLIGLFSLKLLFGSSGGLTEGWGYRVFWVCVGGGDGG